MININKHKALIINDKNNDISYNKSRITNAFAYKVTLDELLCLFKDDPESIYAYDTSECLTFITNDDKEIPLSEYRKYPDKNDFIFCRIINQKLSDAKSDIIISLKDEQPASPESYSLISDPVQRELEISGGYNYIDFMNKVKEIKLKALADFNGYENTEAMMSRYKDFLSSMPVLKYCQDKSIETEKYIYTGYIPSLGQLCILDDTINLLDYIFKDVRNKISRIIYKTWTSTSMLIEKDRFYVMLYRDYVYAGGKKNISANLPVDKGSVYPLFKQISK